MKFEYIPYENDIFESVVDDIPKIYVFDKVSNKNFAKEYYLKLTGSHFGKRSLFFTNSELRERIFLSDKILLKEEKPVLLFYQALSPDMKKKLKVDNYYDIIDTAENFLSFYRLVNEFQVDNVGELEEWQKDVYENFEAIKIKYDELLEKYSYTVQSEIEKLDNLDLSLISGYEEIVFVNKFNFSPLEKNILSKLCSQFKVKICLQILKGDFDEENLCLKKVSCPIDLKNRITVLKTKDKFVQLINFISLLGNNRFSILDADSDSNEYQQILCQNFIKSASEIRLSESRIFKFLSKWHVILEGAELREKRLHVRTVDLLEALNSEIFREYYKIDFSAYKEFIRLVSEDYKYVTKHFLDELTVSKIPLFEKLTSILSDIEMLYSFSNLKEFTGFLEDRSSFDFARLNDFEFSDTVPKYFEALSEVLSVENMGILKSWDGYFSKNRISEGLFRLILKYLRHKPISYTAFVKSENTASIENISEAGDIKRDRLIVLNAYEGVIPSREKNGFLLTAKQKESLGISMEEQNRLVEKQNFFRHIFSCDKTVIFTIVNEEKNIEASSFLEELNFKYNTGFEDAEYSELDCMHAVRDIFSSNEFIRHSKDILGDFYQDRKDSIKLLHEDFKDGLDISSYSYSELTRCRYYFFIKRVAGLQEEIFTPEYKIDAKLLGIISHNFMEEVARLKSDDVKRGNFSLDVEKLNYMLENQLNKLKLKIPVDYLKYYKKIIFPIVINSVEKFYSDLENIFLNENVKTFSAEKRDKVPLFKDSQSNLNVSITGRMDLLVETESSNYIYDYKTGKGDISQLDFYSILFYGESDLSKKYIYNILDSELIPEGSRKNVLSRDLLTADIKSFLNDRKYSRTEKISVCGTCEYTQICQRRWENE